ncbi:DMT family transporter [Vibrio sp. ZSDE26]|uniref:DMT family transporter n=1 Tax=Vibrio amylolyticus TaxID=2847292 RepID=A0A9X2BJQ0_9VIBR|nr:DMT family transporter [Vibrio amylolyticus]MCK6263647.1 DMT family transporter [Vibrio amylolyticus]
MISGYSAIFATIVLWSGFFLSLRGGAISSLTPADMAMTRFLIPAIVLLPITFYAREKILLVPKRYLIGMMIGGGLPYLLVAGWAMNYATVSDGSALVPGTLPLFVSAIAVLFFAQPLSSHRKIGIFLIVVGISIFIYSGFSSANNEAIQGYLLFLFGSLMWAIFTICARIANLPSLVCAGIISLSSLAILSLLLMIGLVETSLFSVDGQFSWLGNIGNWPIKELIGHLLLQGVGAGLLASFTYLKAISILGAERTAAFGSLTPVVATLLAIFVFNETPGGMTWLALVSICIGSIVASNVFLRQDSSLSYQPPSHTK